MHGKVRPGRWLGVTLLIPALLFLSTLPLAAAEGVTYNKLKLGEREVLRLSLPPEIATSWQDANVGRILVRNPTGQHQLRSDLLTKSKHLDLTPEMGGCSMIQVEVGPPSGKGRRDAWRRVTRCTKIVECTRSSVNPGAELAARQGSSAMMTSKVGSRIEIRPLLSPALLRPGTTLPLRVYFDGEVGQGALVEAQGPGNLAVSGQADAVGIATLEIAQPGRWTVRYRATSEGVEFLAELIFEVPSLEAWTLMEGAAR